MTKFGVTIEKIEGQALKFDPDAPTRRPKPRPIDTPKDAILIVKENLAGLLDSGANDFYFEINGDDARDFAAALISLLPELLEE